MTFDVASDMAAKVAERVRVTAWMAITDMLADEGAVDALTSERIAQQHDTIVRLEARNLRLEEQNRELRELLEKHVGGIDVAERADFQSVVFADSPDVPGLVKIGCAKDPSARYETKLGLRVLFTEPGGATRERQHHRRFSSLRVPSAEVPEWVPADGRTEWFRVDGELGDYIALRTRLLAA